jgi:hypothetical protein
MEMLEARLFSCSGRDSWLIWVSDFVKKGSNELMLVLSGLGGAWDFSYRLVDNN